VEISKNRSLQKKESMILSLIGISHKLNKYSKNYG
jgi:hypothetical protein